jgi:DNA-binding NarL/FixJ family response regulator
MIRIVIADDHAIVREGLKRLLAGAADMTVTGEAMNGGEVMQRVRDDSFEVLLLDLSMPGKSGIELIKQVHDEKPALRILVFSMHEETQYAVRALKAGAAGYLTKESASEQLLAAIRKVAAGGAHISAAVAEQLAQGVIPRSDAAPHTTLSNREYQVFEMLAAGASVSEIAQRLNLSVKTVSTHKAHVMQKMSLANPSELVRYAINHRLLDNPDASQVE